MAVGGPVYPVSHATVDVSPTSVGLVMVYPVGVGVFAEQSEN